MLNIFISWSGTASKRIARELESTFKALINVDDVFLSEIDINKGSQWRKELKKGLKEKTFGFFIFTKNQQTSEWMAYEAGSIHMNSVLDIDIDPSMVALLFNVEETIIPKYLDEYQHVKFSKDDYKKFMFELNKNSSQIISQDILEKRFDLTWETFKTKVTDIIKEETAEIIASKDNSVNNNDSHIDEELNNINTSLRELNKIISKVHDQMSNDVHTVHKNLGKLAKDFNDFRLTVNPLLSENLHSLDTSSKIDTQSMSELSIIIERIERDGLLGTCLLKQPELVSEIYDLK